jgi:hypothetical protein
MPELALLLDRHSGKMLPHEHARRVHTRYERLATIAQRAGRPELAECVVYRGKDGRLSRPKLRAVRARST